MPRKILVVGAGQSGLQLALGLQQHGYDVTVMSARTPQEIRDGKVMSTQVMFDHALQVERDLGLNFWEEQTPRIDSIQITVAGTDDSQSLNWLGHLNGYAQSVDQRIKMAAWMEEFEKRAAKLGGRLVFHGATVSDLKALSEMGLFDLIVVAAGKGEIVDLFDRNAERSPYIEAQRKLAVVYVHGLKPPTEFPGTNPVNINLLPGAAGELFVIPALTTSGACHILFFEAVPEGDLDRFAGIRNGEDHLRLTLELMQRYASWEHWRGRDGVKLTDWSGYLAGHYTPMVRQPVAQLKDGGIALGMADVVVANDPITGQGSNNAARCAAIYQQAILDHGGKPFDEEFMRQTFERYWDYAQWVTTWTNAMLKPPPPHVSRILGAAQQHQEIRDRFANGFNDPRDFFDWLMDPGKAYAYLAEVKSRTAARRTAEGHTAE